MQRPDLSIGQRLGIGFGILLALLAIQLYAGLSLRRHIDRLEDERALIVAPREDAGIALQVSLLNQAVAVRAYALSPAPGKLANYHQAARDSQRAFEDLARSLGNDAWPGGAHELPARLRQYEREAGGLTALIQSGADRQSIQSAEARLAEMRVTVLGLVGRLAQALSQRREALRAEIDAAQARLDRTLWVLTATILVIGVVTAVVTMQALRRPTRLLVRAARALQQGDYKPALAFSDPSRRVTEGPPRDELKELSLTFAHMADALLAREARLAADARLSAAVAAGIAVEEVAGGALREAARFTRSEFGAIYLAEKDAGTLRLVAGYAADGAAPTLHAVEGIPGQALLDGRTLIVRDIPTDAPFRVRFGVDELPPRAIAATPILFGSEPVGVLVVGSLRDFPEASVHFLENACRQLGVGLRNAQAHAEIQALAVEVQERNERLAAQSEELQSQNEELQSQNEELQSQSEEIQAQNEELQSQSEEMQAQNEELQALSDQVREQNDTLAEADERKNEFLAMLAHELRNPLAAIANACYLLNRDGERGAKSDRLASIVERQTGHLTRMVDDLLDVSRITRGRIELRKERVDLRVVVQRAVEAARAFVDSRGHALSLSLPPESLWVDGDPTRLEQILTNLLNNAAKYTDPHGAIRIDAARDGDEAVLRVRDNGIGIPREMLPRIFELFTQSDRALDRSQGGLGIGLTMVARLVEMHGGRVEAHSEGLGKGSEFAVRLPLGAMQADGPAELARAAGAAAPRETPSLRVLLVDDNKDAADTFSDLIQVWGHEVRVAYDGAQALVLAPEWRPHVVLLDIGLPGMDGYEVARRMRLEPDLARTPIVAVTGYGTDEDRRRAEAAGFTDHLTKPVTADVLREVIAGAARS